MAVKTRFFQQSIYTKTILQLTVAIVLVFLILGLVNYNIVSQTTIRQQADKLLKAAGAVSETVAVHLNEEGEIDNWQATSFINFSARSTGALVWVINNRGEIIMQTGIPGPVIEKLEKSERNYYQLDQAYRPGQRSGLSGISMTGDFRGLFNKTNEYWLSVAYPIPSGRLGYSGEIQFHYPQKKPTFGNYLSTSGLVISFLVAFAFALLINGVLSQTFTRPIRLLSEASNRVARGDLTARVDVFSRVKHKKFNPLRSFVTDDLAMLAGTFNNMTEKLANQERDRKDFISSVSHDLRTPITSIRGFVEGILDGTIPPEKSEHYLEIVNQQTRRLQDLVDTMFEGSVMETKNEIDQSVFDLNQVMDETVSGLETLLTEKNLSVETNCLADEKDRQLVIGDREAIARVIYNIVTNAIRFTPENGLIRIQTERSGRAKEILVLIEDSGPGIVAQERPYIFDRFYKVDKSRTAQGSGLGLYICRTILAAHGQQITVEQSDLGGSNFIFTLSTP